jgi:integrase
MLFKDLAEVMLAQKDLRDKTFENYTGALRRNIFPHFANSDVSELNRFDITKVLSKLPTQTHYQTLMALRSILHGLRWGEAVVLTESDIKDGMVVINKSIHGLTKSVTSNRSVPYLGYFKPFPKSRHALNRYLDKHEVNIHSLRKSYAYILKRNGIHVTTAQKLMGHASPMVTMRIYTAVLSEEIIEAGEILRIELKL